MNHLRSEQLLPQARRKRLLAVGVLASLVLAFGAIRAAGAVDPPQPDFFWPYGKVQVDGENISPPVQRVIAIVNGQACGEAMTLVAQAGPGVPAGDVGKTVYVVDISAAGSNPGQRPGCGFAGAPVSLYFPELRRFALQQTVFFAGNQRLDLDLGPEMPFRLVAPLLSTDGLN